jgi:hypothetical protein
VKLDEGYPAPKKAQWNYMNILPKVKIILLEVIEELTKINFHHLIKKRKK